MGKATKTDKGFELSYWKLSYRRKFIRTLYLLPLVPLTSVFCYLDTHSLSSAVILAIVLFMIGAIQIIYTYRKWKCTEPKE